MQMPHKKICYLIFALVLNFQPSFSQDRQWVEGFIILIYLASFI
jgi:hypothetical protein